LFEHSDIAFAVRFDGKTALITGQIIDFNYKVVFRQNGHPFVGPFDDTNAIAEKIIVQTKVADFGDIIQTVKIHVVESKTAVQFPHDDEGWTERIFVDIEAVSDALGEAGFTGAQFPDE
jgi:hypothetical protein